jgi:hypothetical protein
MAGARLVHAAIDAGVTFLDNACDYNDGLLGHVQLTFSSRILMLRNQTSAP